MNLICIAFVVCLASSPGKDRCEIVSSECASVPPQEEARVLAKCDASPDCVVARPGLLVVRVPAPPAPSKETHL